MDLYNKDDEKEIRQKNRFKILKLIDFPLKLDGSIFPLGNCTKWLHSTHTKNFFLPLNVVKKLPHYRKSN